jgi:hypothetical protein
MRDDHAMRTTLDLDLDVLQAAKEIAETRGMSAGQVVSELVRKALASPTAATVRHGVPLLALKAGASPLTMSAVNRMRDE